MVFKILGRAFFTRFGSAYIVMLIPIQHPASKRKRGRSERNGEGGGREREREKKERERASYFISLWYFLHPCSFTITNIHHRGLPSFCNLYND
jgi:hypothetical protein